MITTIMLDRGHGTLDKNGNYVTPGKRASFPSGEKVYEGVENNKYVMALAKYAKEAGFNVVYSVLPSNHLDVSLTERVTKANKHPSKNSMFFLSVHNNASGTGQAQGTEIFTSKGQTLSDIYAEHILKQFKSILPHRKLRTDTVDKDLDKEENFYVLRATLMPSVLIEYGFFDNYEDYKWLSDENNIDLLARCTIDGIVSANIDLYGEHIYPLKT